MKKLEIKKEDLEKNLNVIKKIISDNNENTKIIAVVKANGMGLDLIQYSEFLISKGIQCLAVANVDEAIKLREAGIEVEILMLSPVLLKNELQLLIKNDITIAIDNYLQLELVEEISKSLEKKVNAHIKIDTGFGRYGFLYSEKEIILEVFKKCENVNITGMFSHFSNPTNSKFTKEQFEKFTQVVSFIKQNDYNPGILHICASTAFLKYPEYYLDAVRIGSALQGRVLFNKEKFVKVGNFKTNIEEIKELPKGYNISYNNTYKTKRKTKVAIIPVGYMDGFNRGKLRDDFSLKNNIIAIGMEIKKLFKDNSLKVKINNKSYKVIGKLGMYHSIIDITESENINIGDEVLIDISPLQANDEIRREFV
jgi:alanine racemase